MRRTWAALLVCSVFFFSQHHAGADEAVTVLVLAPAVGDPLAVRLEAELRALGFEVTVKRGDADGSLLETVARGSGAIAAIRVVQSDSGAEVWVADRITGKTLLRNVDAQPGDDRTSVFAVRAVELLRASLLEVEATHPTRGEIAPPPVVEHVVATSRPPRATPFALGVGLGPQLDPTLSPSFHAFATLAWSPSRLGIEIIGLIPIASAQVCKPEGCAEIASGLLGGGARLVLAQGRIRPELAAGFAASFVHANGQPARQTNPPLLGESSGVVAAAVYGRATIAFAPSRYFRIGLDVLGGSALPPTPIRFAGAEVAHWGGPFVSLLLRSEVAF